MSNAAPLRHRVDSTVWTLLVATLLILVRNPLLLLRGRVYAEEGTTYLRFAWEANWLHALVATHQGYYSLVPNVVSLFAARVIPLASVGLLLPWCALLFQLLAVWLVLQCESFQSRSMKMLAVLVVVLAPPSGEAWLNTLNSQFYLAICTALIVISKPRRVHLAILFVAGLTGVISCFLFPFFWIRALMERTRAVIIQAALISLCTALQVMAVVHLGMRHTQHNFAYMLEAVANKNVLLVFGTSFPAIRFDRFAIAHPSAALLLAALILLVFAGLLLRAASLGGRTAIFIAAMAVWCEGCALFCGLDVGQVLVSPYANGRYFLFSNICLGLVLVLAYGGVGIHSAFRLIAAVGLGALLLSGLLDYRRASVQTALGPDWRSQVTEWNANPAKSIHVFPDRWRPLHLTSNHPDLNLPDDAYDSTNPNAATQ